MKLYGYALNTYRLEDEIWIYVVYKISKVKIVRYRVIYGPLTLADELKRAV
jgi:hypothetical protein